MKPRPRRAKPTRGARKRRLPPGCVRYMQVKGKTVDFAELWLRPDNCSVTLWFQDKTCLHFSLDPGLSVQTDYFDWKGGEQRAIKRWPPVSSD